MHGDNPQARSDSGESRSRLLRLSLYTLAAILALGCVLLVGLRVLLPEIRHLRPEIEGWVSGVFEREVRFGAIDAYWRGWIPVLRIEDVRLVDAETDTVEDGTSPRLRLAEVSFSIDPMKSIRLLSVQPFDISARGASIEVVRNDDGTLSLHGLGEPSDAGSHRNSRFLLWALAQSRVSLFDSRAVWIDRRSGSPDVALDDVTLHLLRGADGYRFSGSFGLPEDGRVEFLADVSGDPLSPSWTGSAYALLQDVGLRHTGLNARLLGGDRFAGRVSGEVWSTWTPDGVVEAEGTVRAELPGIVQGEVRHGVDELNTAFRIGRADEGWELALRDFVVVTPLGEWPRTSAQVKWTPSRRSGDGIVVVNAGYLRIDDLIAVVTPDGGASSSAALNALIASAPRGGLEDLHISAPIAERVELGRIRARGRFVELGLGSDSSPVSLDTASGRFEAGEQGLVADVDSGTLRISLPRWFAHPLRGEDLTGTLTALPSPEGLRFRFDGVNTTTSTGTMSAHGWVLAPHDRSGLQLDVSVDVGAARFAAARTLLADRTLPERVSRWLENAASDGEIRAAQVHIRSLRPGEPAVGRGRGRSVSVTADLAFPSFRYARNWPELSDVSGRLMWRNGGRLEAQVDAGRILDSNIRTGSIVVGDLHAGVPEVEVRGSLDGMSADLIRFLTESPLRRRFAQCLRRLDRARRQQGGLRSRNAIRARPYQGLRRRRSHGIEEPGPGPVPAPGVRDGVGRDRVRKCRRAVRRPNRYLARRAPACGHRPVSRAGQHHPPLDREPRDEEACSPGFSTIRACSTRRAPKTRRCLPDWTETRR